MVQHGAPMETSVDAHAAREHFANRAWSEAFDAMVRADLAGDLKAEDLELLGRAAYMLGRDDDYVAALERAAQVHATAGRPARAARCGFWIGLNLMPRGEVALGSGWFARAERWLGDAGGDCVERGYLMIPALLGCVGAGDASGAHAIACTICDIAEQYADADLRALGCMEKGHALVRLGRHNEGNREVDEVLVALATRELSPVVTGIVYCNTILFCASVFDLVRAKEWTAALSRWCDEQPGMIAHAGLCMVHRAEVMDLEGAWDQAMAEADAAVVRTEGVLNAPAAGYALYRRAEILRRQGALDAAEAAYTAAAAQGREPQPGLALLRLAQGKADSAVAMIRRVEAETQEPLDRAPILPAYVEILLAAGDVDEARRGCVELGGIATTQSSSVLDALAAQARGAVALAEGDARRALVAAREAWKVWHAFGAPHECARIRVLVARACRTLGDGDTATIELRTARDAFLALGAEPDVRAADLLLGADDPATTPLTAREREVLHLLAGGATNRAIAQELTISERTVERHVSNILTKLDLSNRSAATAYAYEHGIR